MHASSTIRVVVVTWNGAHLLPECLDSLRAQTIVDDLEVVVVDNASTDGTAELLASRYPEASVVHLERNLGFAGGAAAGAADFRGLGVAFLNNDATFAPDAVERLREALVRPGAEDIGAVTARLLLAGSDPLLVNSTGNVVSRAGTGGDRDWRVPAGTESTDPDVFGFCGGAALIRTSAYLQTGGFDASLFLYYEDTDLSWRLRAAGWRVEYVRTAVAMHRHAATSDTTSPLFRYQNTRNSLIVFTRHAPVAVVAVSAARQALGLLRAVIREPAAAATRARARGLRDWLRRLPQTWRERTSLWRGAAVSRREVARYLS